MCLCHGGGAARLRERRLYPPCSLRTVPEPLAERGARLLYHLVHMPAHTHIDAHASAMSLFKVGKHKRKEFLETNII